MNARAWLRPLAPRTARAGYRRLRGMLERRRARQMTIEDVFAEIYARRRWGGGEGFDSGRGSSDDAVVLPYVAAISAVLAGEAGRLVFVDLGCGDFRVGRRLRHLAARYVGVDVVRPLIDRNRAAHGGPTTTFLRLDIVRDPLPDGDVCFVRQVLQHLSNDQISRVLAKLMKYRRVFITEHCASEDARFVPNLDKPHGGDTRVLMHSGVRLTAPPFDLPEHSITEVLRVPGVGMPEGHDPGVITTFLYEPRRDTVSGIGGA